MLGAFASAGSPYLRVDGGPMIPVGRPARGSWAVSTIRVRRSTWLQWAEAEVSGGHTIRRGVGSSDQAMSHAMDTSQTYAALVAAQLAAGRSPVAGAGLQVLGDGQAVRAAGLRPGDVMLAAGDSHRMTPLRAQTDLWQNPPRRKGTLRLLVVPDTGSGWGVAEIRLIPAARLEGVRAGPAVSATTYPLGDVQGPSAGLILALARIDDLTAGDLTGGRAIAGTGVIGLDGAVAGVGGVAEKARAAVSARTDVFFVPFAQRTEALHAAQGTHTRIVPVHSVAQAVGWLCTTGGHSPLCRGSASHSPST
jgi:PDZ domain-containing secreted protein